MYVNKINDHHASTYEIFDNVPILLRVSAEGRDPSRFGDSVID